MRYVVKTEKMKSIIEAVKWDGKIETINDNKWLEDEIKEDRVILAMNDEYDKEPLLLIFDSWTREYETVEAGDYVIKETHNQKHRIRTMKSDNFEEMFEVVEDKENNCVVVDLELNTEEFHKKLNLFTPVGLDHMEYLGDTIAKIAGEKAGIIKPSVPVVYFKRDAVSSGIIETHAKELDSAVTAVEKSNYIINEIDDKTIDFSFHNRYYNYDHLRIPKTSLYQVENTCLAVASFDILMQTRDIEYGKNAGADVRIEQAVRSGLLDFSWEGRMEEIAPDLFVDGAHNPEAVECYCRTLRTLYTKKKKILVFAAVKDKDYDTMIRDLTEALSFEKIIVTSVDNKRKAPVSLIADRFRNYTGHTVEAYEDIAEAMDAAIRYKEQITDSAVYCVGSLYLVGEVKRWLQKIKEKSANMEE